MYKSPQQIICSIPLSNSSVQKIDERIEELLFSRNLETYTKGSSICNAVEICFNENNVPLNSIVSCATDGALSMVGRH